MGDARLGPTVVDFDFIRPGSLGLTSRRPGQSPHWANARLRRAEISLGLCKHPLCLTVREFIPGPADAVDRLWIAPDGVTQRRTPLSRFAIADYSEAANVVHEYISDNCLCFGEVAAQSHPAVRAVYASVADYVRELRSLVSAGQADAAHMEQYELVERYCPLWFGIRNMMGSAWLVGDDKLDMEPVEEEGYPLYGKISVPRQVVQTAGLLLNEATKLRQTRFLESLRHALDPVRGQERRPLFFTLFLIVFVLLHECEDISKDRERYARQNFETVRFSLPEYVATLHQNARQLVEHWLAYAENMGVDFSTKAKLQETLSFLPAKRRDLIVDSYDSIVGQTSPLRASPETWTKDLCFVSHMFGVSWAENALYRGN